LSQHYGTASHLSEAIEQNAAVIGEELVLLTVIVEVFLMVLQAVP